MFEYEKKKTLPYPSDFLFDIVLDVESYPKFLPWITSSHIYNKGGNDHAGSCLGDLSIGYGFIAQSYTSHIDYCRTAGQGGEQENKHTHPFIQARHVKGPFDHLSNMWVFRALDDHNTQVHFSIRFELDSTLLKNILEPILEKASYSIIDSFESRARTLWGAS